MTLSSGVDARHTGRVADAITKDDNAGGEHNRAENKSDEQATPHQARKVRLKRPREANARADAASDRGRKGQSDSVTGNKIMVSSLIPSDGNRTSEVSSRCARCGQNKKKRAGPRKQRCRGKGLAVCHLHHPWQVAHDERN